MAVSFQLTAVQVVALAVVAQRMHAMGVIDLQHWLPSSLVQLAGIGHTCGLRDTDHLILTSSRVVFPGGISPGAVSIKGGKIVAIVAFRQGDSLVKQAQAAFKTKSYVKSYGNLIVSPGLVDTHVHMNEPGREEWEGFVTATQAAAAGGITTLVDMPLNSMPCTVTTDLLKAKIAAAKGKLHVDVGFWGGLTPENSGNTAELQGILDAGALGLKSFISPSGIKDFPNCSRSDVEAALPVLRRSGAPLLVHAEIFSHIEVSGDPRKYSTYLQSRPRSFEKDAVRMLLEALRQSEHLGRQPGFSLHIVHLSDADLLPELMSARDAGLPVSVETCAHYLTFAAEDIPDGDTRFKCAPPLREQEVVERLWKGLQDGIIDSVSSDHSPSSPDVKLFDTGDFVNSWGGFAGLQYSLPATWSGMIARGLGPELLTRWWSEAPAKLASLQDRKGRLAIGFDADIVVWDPEALADTSEDACRHKHTSTTAYRDQQLRGRVKATYLRGQQVFSDAKGVANAACGSTLLRGSLT